MNGSEKNFRGPPFASSDLPRSLPPPVYAIMNNSRSYNNNNSNNNNSSRQDAAGGMYAFSNRFYDSHGPRTTPYQPYHHRWPRGPSREHGSTDDHRHWIHNTTLPPPSADKFILVSYNILGVENVNQHCRELYWNIPSYILEWNYRKKRILVELGLWAPDIICLQEVDRFEDLQNDLVQKGYEGLYKGRTGGSCDGCAMFWRAKKFDLLQEESIEYQELNLRHNVAQLCVLQTRRGVQSRGKGKRSKEMIADNRVVVCNIHVLFNPNRGEFKLGQVRHLLEKAHSLSQEWGGIPVIFAGDFNSVPQSPLYQFLRDAVLDVSWFDRRAISGQVEAPWAIRATRTERWTSTTQIQIRSEGQVVQAEATSSSENLCITEDRPPTHYEWTSEELQTATGSATESIMRHRFNLRSAYSCIQGSEETRDTGNEPLVTTYHGKFIGTVDYIWFNEGLLPVKVLDVLPVHILRRTKGLPSKKWGSDHLALACEFAFSDGRTSKGDTTMEETGS